MVSNIMLMRRFQPKFGVGLDPIELIRGSDSQVNQAITIDHSLIDSLRDDIQLTNKDTIFFNNTVNFNNAGNIVLKMPATVYENLLRNKIIISHNGSHYYQGVKVVHEEPNRIYSRYF